MVGQRRDAVVVESCRRGAEDGHVLPAAAEVAAVAEQLTRHIAVRVEGTAPVELVDGDDVGVVEHVDLLELACGAELRRHDVEGHIGELCDGVVSLTDARSLDNDEVVASQCTGAHGSRQVRGHRAFTAGGDRAEEDPVIRGGVHADAIAQQSAAATGPCGVDGEHGNADLAGRVQPDASHDLVGEAGLARAARAGDPQDGHGVARARGVQGIERRRLESAVSDRREESSERDLVAGHHRLEGGPGRARALAATGEHVIDHADEPEALAVLG